MLIIAVNLPKCGKCKVNSLVTNDCSPLSSCEFTYHHPVYFSHKHPSLSAGLTKLHHTKIDVSIPEYATVVAIVLASDSLVYSAVLV